MIKNSKNLLTEAEFPTLRRCFLSFFCLVILVCICSHVPVFAGEFLNYENSKNLEQANFLLSPQNPNIAKFDREEVVNLLLKYLEECPDTLNRTAVYAKIGILYIQYENKSTKTERDFVKGKEYLLKAIEADPKYINYHKMIAYTNLSSLPASKNEQVDEGIKTYQTLHDIPDAMIAASAEREAKMLKSTLVKGDGTTERTPLSEEAFQKKLKEKINQIKIGQKSLLKQEKMNLLAHASRAEVPEIAFSKIIKELQNCPEVVEEAKTRLGEISGDKFAGIASSVSIVPVKPEKKADAISVHPEVGANAPNATSKQVVPPSSSKKTMLGYVCIASVFVLVSIVVFVKVRRRKN